MATFAKPFITAEQYLDLERKAEFKSEYLNGEVFVMAGAKVSHGRIIRNLGFELNNALPQDCELFLNNLRLEVLPSGLFTYPDLMVVCGEVMLRDDAALDTLLNPTVIIEVLSPSTQSYDRGDKFELYKGLASLKEYVLVAQDKMHVETRVRRSNRQWLVTDHFGHDREALKFDSIGVEIDLGKLYYKVDWAGNQNLG